MGSSRLLKIGKQNISEFQRVVFDFYSKNARNLPWRKVDSSGQINPYHVLVSEIMLQQTQVSRVLPKYDEFITRFPDVSSLSKVNFADVLRVWNGLGYNRRAKYLHDFAKSVADKNFPSTIDELKTYKGIGYNTAAAILVYAFDQRHIFVETNIRTVMLHHMIDKMVLNITDTEVANAVEMTLPEGSVREWYWALMDYGSYLKRQGASNNQKSAHYKKQSTFKGSKRELRADVLRTLLATPKTEPQLKMLFKDARLQQVLHELTREKLIVHKNHTYYVAD